MEYKAPIITQVLFAMTRRIVSRKLNRCKKSKDFLTTKARSHQVFSLCLGGFVVQFSCGVSALGLFIFLSKFGFTMNAQDKGVGHGKKCAVCLTYDDALNVHLDHVVPILDSLGFKGTFYLSGYFPSFRERVAEWKSVAAKGHELGNHTLFHPCTGKLPDREWVKPDYDLGNYTMQRLVDEIKMANTLLEALDGKTKRSFAYPCGDTKIGDSSYVDKIREDFVAARGVKGEMPNINEIDLYNVGSYVINGQSGEELIALVKQAMKNDALIVFLFHGVGGEHSLNISLSDHRKLLRFLKQNEKDIWIAPFINIAEYVKELRREKQ